MMTPLVFLDIDGVLNDHTPHENGYCGIEPRLATRFNRILRETSAEIVVSSAWRYMMFGGHMSFVGFANMLATHGLDVIDRVAGFTGRDTMIPSDAGQLIPKPNERGEQITRWLKRHPTNSRRQRRHYVVIDDLDLGITEAGHPFVQTDGKVGLTTTDAGKAIEILTGRAG
jgi:hypothetical protein